MSLDADRLAMIRANAALAIEEFQALSGADFGYDAPSVAWVEGFVERMRKRYSEDGAPSGMVSVIGSYLGEAIISGTGGEWIEDDAGGLGVRFENGDTAYPFVKVQKQFDDGLAGGESIASFYNVSVTLVAAGKLHDGDARPGGAS